MKGEYDDKYFAISYLSKINDGFKGTVSLISSDLPSKDGNACFTLKRFFTIRSNGDII